MKRSFNVLGLVCSLLASNSASAQDCNPCLDCEPCRGRFEVGGDWLYWKAAQEGLEFAAVVTLQGGFTVTTADFIRPKFKESNGYRVFAGYETADCLWNVKALYTHLPSNASVNVSIDPADATPDFITILDKNFPLLNGVSQVDFTSVNARWDLDLDYVDLDLSRNFDVCKWLQISPHIGLRGLWSRQKYTTGGAVENTSYTSTLKERTWIYGVEGGVSGLAKIAGGFSLVGRIGGSLLYGKIDNRGSITALDNGTLLLESDYRDDTYHTLPTVEAFIGIQYVRNLCNTTVNIHAGWEQFLLFNANQYAISSGANLFVQGLTVGGSVSF